MIHIQIQIVFPEYFSLFFTNILYLLHTKREHCTEMLRKVHSKVIKCKTIKGEEIRRQEDGHSDSHFLNFKQLRQGCICGEIHFFFTVPEKQRLDRRLLDSLSVHITIVFLRKVEI